MTKKFYLVTLLLVRINVSDLYLERVESDVKFSINIVKKKRETFNSMVQSFGLANENLTMFFKS